MRSSPPELLVFGNSLAGKLEEKVLWMRVGLCCHLLVKHRNLRDKAVVVAHPGYRMAVMVLALQQYLSSVWCLGSRTTSSRVRNRFSFSNYSPFTLKDRGTLLLEADGKMHFKTTRQSNCKL